ncbi:MAG TPA: endonuclease domain-containing protein [Dehalococcoidia bacterium]|nr:endonuclease domain-containing protein [Dehalococcoidia bacterium]
MRAERVRGVSPELAEAARRLRQEATPAERVLWQALRGGRLAGLKFRRQHAVGPFVLDFFCPKHKLVVEVDGAVHNTPDQRDRDAGRDERLQQVGYRVLRLRNAEVLGDLDRALGRIAEAVRPSPPDPLSQSWERGDSVRSFGAEGAGVAPRTRGRQTSLTRRGDSARSSAAEGAGVAPPRPARRSRAAPRAAQPDAPTAPSTPAAPQSAPNAAHRAARPPKPDAPKAPSPRPANPTKSRASTPGSPPSSPRIGRGRGKGDSEGRRAEDTPCQEQQPAPAPPASPRRSSR